jgi:hypothetical protein
MVRREPAADAGGRREVAQRGASRRCGPRPASRRTTDYAEERSDWHCDAELEPRVEMLPAPAVHTDLAAFTAFPAANNDAATYGVEVALGERERFADPQSRSPKHDDQRAGTQTMCAIAGAAHDRRISSSARVDRPDSYDPCCAADSRDGSQAWSPASGDDQRHREAQK